MQLAMVEYIYDDFLERLVGKGFFEIGLGGDLALGDVEEDVFDLQDVGKILFDLVAPLEDFVLVACDFEALLAWGVSVECRIGRGGLAGSSHPSSCAPATRWSA